jgi:hypothetical protein
MGTISKLDENNGTLMEIPPPHPLKNEKHPLGACWRHSIGSPHLLYPKVLFMNKLLVG